MVALLIPRHIGRRQEVAGTTDERILVTRGRSAALIALVLVTLVGVALSQGGDDGTETATSVTGEGCGLRPRDPALDPAELPDFARFEGVEIVALDDSRGSLTGAVNVPLSVAGLLAEMRERIDTGGYEVIHEDDEGFEAEIFIRGANDAGIVRIARSLCRDFSSMVFQLPQP
jgi:hypothetical protein